MSRSPSGAIRGTVFDLQMLAGRVEAQIGFARSLCELEKGKAAAFGRIIAQAEALAAKVFASGSVAEVRRGVAGVEAALAPIGKAAKQYTIYCVGHAHIDMNWMWGWPETVATTNDTFATMLALMEEFPTFHLSQSQASAYALIQRHNPALLKRIAERVKEGRWEVTASHWVEGDRNMVSGESLTRHLLYTRRYMKELFGLSPEDVQIDWSPDTFGHPITVPMYLRRGGVKWVYLHRPGAHGPKRPGAFWWESPDGSRVLVRNDMVNAYVGVFLPRVWKVASEFARETGLKCSMFVYGVGDHGGGPTRRDMALAVEMNTWPIFPNLKLSRASEFYAQLEKQGDSLPTLKCELNTEVTGCYTTQSLVKRGNRVAENRLLDAEAFCTMASAAAGRPYPKADFEEGWRDTLFGHFHDILPGSNVHDSRTYFHGLFQKTMASTSMNETLALRALAAEIDTRLDGVEAKPAGALTGRSVLGAGAGFMSDHNLADAAEQTAGGTVRPFVIFNPTAWERAEIIEVTVWTDAQAWEISQEMRHRHFEVCGPGGEKIPAQKIDQGVYNSHAYVKLAFPVKAGALGYATYTVNERDEAPEGTVTLSELPWYPVYSVISLGTAAKKGGPEAHQSTSAHHCSYLFTERREEGLENDLVRLEVDPMTGGIRRLVEKRSGGAVIDRPGDSPLLEYLIEKPHGMSAWLIDNFNARETPRVMAIERKLDGPHKASLQVKLSIHESELTLTYELRAGDPRVHLHLEGTWFQRGTPQTGVPVLRLSLPLAMTEVKGTYEIPFGAIERELNRNEEVPALNWAMASGKLDGKRAGVVLSNDCKHGHALEGSTLHLTLIRSAYNPDILPEIGQHEVHLTLLPFVGEMGVAEAIRTGRELNRPLRVVGTGMHMGKLAAVGSAVTVENVNVILADLKKAEEGKAVIVRLLNATASMQPAGVRLDEALLGAFGSVTEVDLMEQPVKGSKAKLARGRVSVMVPGQTVVSLKLSRG